LEQNFLVEMLPHVQNPFRRDSKFWLNVTVLIRLRKFLLCVHWKFMVTIIYLIH